MSKNNSRSSEHNLPPSKRKPIKYIKVPDGCTEVWQVLTYTHEKPANPYTDIFLDSKQAFNEADIKWKLCKGGRTKVAVGMKAAVRIGDRYHIVYKAPISFAELSPLTPAEPKQKVLSDVMTEWDKERPPIRTWVMASYGFQDGDFLCKTCKQGCCVDIGIGPMRLPKLWRLATTAEIDEGISEFERKEKTFTGFCGI